MNKTVEAFLSVIILAVVYLLGVYCHSSIIEKKYSDRYTLANIESLSEIENIETGISIKVWEKTAKTEPYYVNNGNGTISMFNKIEYDCKGEGPIYCPTHPEFEFVEMIP